MKHATTNARIQGLVFLALAGSALLSACSSQWYREAVDREAYAIIKEKQGAVFGETRPFDVVQSPEQPARVALCAEVQKARAGPKREPEPLKLDLVRCLEVAAVLDREFQNEKETLFISALSLSDVRWEFDWQPTLTGLVGMEGNRRNARVFTESTFTLSKALRTGASVLSTLLGSLSRSITSGVPWNNFSLLNIGLTQPLLRGFGPHIAMESLTQAERNVIYGVRSFERFRRAHVVEITTEYYDVLEQMNRIEIEEANLDNLNVSLALQTALYQAGKLPRFQVDQTQQSVLTSEATLLRLRMSVRSALDELKITLGLPMDTRIELDRTDFAELQKRGIQELNLDESQAISLALENRLDLKTLNDRIADAKRKVVIAADALRLGLDLDMDLAVPSRDNKAWQVEWTDVFVGGTLRWDIPLNQIPQRNAYRTAIITYERSVRDYALLVDNVQRQVRLRVRDIRQIEQDYKIQVARVKLAGSQVDETTEKQRAGRAITRDVLEARESLVNAQSELARLLVAYKTAQLDLLRDLEILKLDPEGLRYDDRLESYRPSADARK